jgi:Spy/CpxP family protein refolding chaperone
MMGYGYCPGGWNGDSAPAQGWYGPGMMGGGMMWRGGFDPQQTSAWLDAAKQAITITPAQEQAWSAYAAAVQADRAAMLAMHAQMPALMGAGNADAPDRLQAHLSLMQTRLASLQQVEAASQALYQVLTPDQRTRANRALWSGCW